MAGVEAAPARQMALLGTEVAFTISASGTLAHDFHHAMLCPAAVPTYSLLYASYSAEPTGEPKPTTSPE